MAHRDVTVVDSTAAIGAYLAALDGALAGPRRTRTAIRDEIEDGLLAAADHHRAEGAAPAAAIRAALAEFGPPEAVARAFSGELAIARARRLILGLLLTGPAVGVWWLLLLAPLPWPPTPGALFAAIPVLPVVAAIVVVGVAVLTATGRLAHRVRVPSPKTTERTWRGLALVCLALDLALLGQVAIRAATSEGHHASLMVAAAAASSARLVWVGLTAGRHGRSAAARS